jgi:hypothetical protein
MKFTIFDREIDTSLRNCVSSNSVRLALEIGNWFLQEQFAIIKDIRLVRLFMYFLLLLLFRVILAILKFVQIEVQKQISKIQKDMTKVAEAFALNLDTLK